MVGGGSPGGINIQGQAIIAKVNSDGEMQWNHSYNNPPNAGFWFSSVAQTDNEGYIAVGYAALFKMDTSGNLQWYTSNSTDVTDILGTTNSVVATGDGGFAVVGGKNNSVWLAKFAPESATPANTPPPPFSTTVLIAVVIIVAVIGAGLGLLIYLIKRK